mmetsp:Transcript_55528/g.140468  ORF Transcript_55528/g.140468 Transcript_55528/m.140468 type:complete len:210 (+) Transcript_55528:1405-2034(+)
MPSLQAVSKQPNFARSCSRKSSSIFCDAGSMSLKLATNAGLSSFCSAPPAALGRCATSVQAMTFQRALTLPVKLQSCTTRTKFPKEMYPHILGSMAILQAATVVPCFALSTCLSCGKDSTPAFATAASFFCEGSELLSLAFSRCLCRYSCPKAFLGTEGAEIGDFGTRMNASSPLCFFRVQDGSRSQIVICCFPGVGCKHLQSFFGLNP